MVTLENVEKLREYANVTYDEAKEALENTGGDLLQAIIELERQGKIKEPEGGGKYVSRTPQQESNNGDNNGKSRGPNGNTQGSSSFNQSLRKFFNWVGRVIRKGNMNSLVVERKGELIINLPVTALVVLLLIGFWVVVPLMIVGLFFNFRYSFAGPDLGNKTVNDAMDNVANAAEDFKRDLTKGDQPK